MTRSNRKTVADLVRENVVNTASDKVLYNWDNPAGASFGGAAFQATHNAHEGGQFTDEKLAKLLDAYPREQLGIYKFPDHSDGVVKADHGRAPKLTGAQILNAVKQGQIWLNLRAVNRHLPAFAELSDELFSQLEQAFGISTLKQDVGVLISSPNIHVHYHLDIPLVTLVQLRGEKTLYLYPAEPPFRSAAAIEKIARRTQDEELHFDHSFENSVQAVTLSPGMAITWPQTAPHRVQNSDSLNVSLSCEFMTMPAILRANAIYANSLLRDKLGVDPAYPEAVGALTMAKAGLARLSKKLSPLREKGPTPITFELLANGDVSYFPHRRVTDFPLALADKPTTEAGLHRSCCMKMPMDLSEQEIVDWRDLQSSCWNFDTPLLSPEFAKLVAQSRQDIRCALVYEGAALKAVLAGHVNSRGEMTPLGAPFCDYSGPMIMPGANLTAQQVCVLAGVKRFKTAAAIETQTGRRSTDVGLQDYGLVISLSGRSAATYLETRRKLFAKRFKNLRRLLNKMEREHGPVEFCFGTPSKSDFDALMGFKSRQFQSEGLLDVTQATYARSILDSVMGTDRITDVDLGGFCTSLKVNGQLVAGHLGVRQGANFHPWISAYDPAFEDYSPGALLLYRCVELMDEMGLQVYDLAQGHEGYKKYFAEPLRAVADFSYAASGGNGRIYRAEDKLWAMIGDNNSSGLAVRLRRRLTMSKYCEPSFFKRYLDLLTAISRRRSGAS